MEKAEPTSIGNHQGRVLSFEQNLRNDQGIYSQIFRRLNSKVGQEYIDSPEKATLETLIVLLASIPAAALILISAIAIYLNDPGPVFYIQERLGKNEEKFLVWKLRSLKTDPVTREEEVAIMKKFKAHQDPRAFRVGKILRATDLDELPQLFQVLSRKHMSLIGQRVLQDNEIERVLHMGDKSKLVDVSEDSSYRDEWKRKGFLSKPSLLSLHSAIARSKRKQMLRCTWLDQIYQEKASLGLDVYILWKNFTNHFFLQKKHSQNRN